MQTLDISKKLMEEDTARARRIANEAHRQGELTSTRFMQAHQDAVRQGDFEPVCEFLNGLITNTKTFALAQVLVEEVAGITEQINEAINNKKPLFGKVPEEVSAKGEVFRTVIIAQWMATVFEQLKQEN